MFVIAFFLFFFPFYCNLGSRGHMQIMQDCCIGTSMARWFAAILPSSPISGISPLVIPPHPPHPAVPPLVAPTDQSV